MKLKMIIVGVMVLSVLVLAGCQSNSEMMEESEMGSEMEDEMENEMMFGWETQSSDGTVMVDLTPEEYVDGKLFVEITVTTHSVDDLDTYDLSKIVTLQAGGEKYFPIEALKLSGHHNSGELVFEIPEEPSQFSVTITNLHDEGVREFSWP
ncbi:hypothetical protein HOI26_04005 [Candidatus Woesearchaeota archaeon]|jgi:hypothetical protein|nr:hypothetical protein [Candidatus Woesearchaeota archaeon]MBT5740240.1 hypothetical protein [Candidatus Woesearchaeota archaeon]